MAYYDEEDFIGPVKPYQFEIEDGVVLLKRWDESTLCYEHYRTLCDLSDDPDRDPARHRLVPEYLEAEMEDACADYRRDLEYAADYDHERSLYR